MPASGGRHTSTGVIPDSYQSESNKATYDILLKASQTRNLLRILVIVIKIKFNPDMIDNSND